MAVATTEAPRRAARPRGGLDRTTVVLFSLAAFLAVLALLISQLAARPTAPARRELIVRREYRTTVIETVLGSTAGGTTVSRSATSSAAAQSAPAAPPSPAPPAPTTRVSGVP